MRFNVFTAILSSEGDKLNHILQIIAVSVGVIFEECTYMHQ